jgi:hypothetical protein
MSIYFKSCGVSGKAADTLYLWKICMNQKWIYGMLERMGEKNHKAMLRDIHERDLPFGGSHDNINLGFRVYEQRRDNKSRFDSGTAATIYTFSDPACVPPDPKAYQRKWQEGVKDPIESLDILDLEANGASKMSLQDNYIVLKILISSPEFDFKTYPHNSDPLFARPPPVQQLPTGPEHALRQYMLDTAHLEEASLTGNDKCIAEWLKQVDYSIICVF